MVVDMSWLIFDCFRGNILSIQETIGIINIDTILSHSILALLDETMHLIMRKRICR